MKTQLSKPYPHHDKFRVRIRNPDGWRWAPSADTPEEAVEAAKSALKVPDPAGKPDPAAAPAIRTVEGVRLDGPHPHHGGWRYRVVASSSDRRWAPVGATEAQALRLAQRLAKLRAAESSMTIRDSVEAFLAAKAQAGIRPVTLDGYRGHLGRFFMSSLDRPLSWLTSHRSQQLYDALREAVRRRGERQRYSVATHRSALKLAKLWAAWTLERGWIREDPLAKVRGVGTIPRGKPQLTIDEARKFYATCLRRADEGDAGAVAAILAVSLGLRTREIVTRTVRDLDDGGRVLRVCENELLGFKLKSRSSKRSLRLPLDLQPILAQRAAGKSPGELLLPNRWGRLHKRQWVWQNARRLCLMAGVPVVCAHSLRGVSATAAAAAGALPELVAQMLGHGSADVTMGHYIKPGTVEAAQLERGHKKLTDED